MRKIIQRFILALIIFTFIIVVGYTYLLSPKDYHFSSYEYINKNITSELNGFTIAYLSDINLTDQKSVTRFEKIVDELNQKDFDMVVIGGDLYDGEVYKANSVAEILKKINCSYGKFALLGEKDQSSALEITQIFNDGGFEVLNNNSRTIYYKDASLQLITCDENTDLTTLSTETQTISLLLSHQPDVFQKTKGTIDLQLSGHSLGGSIYIPYYGALFKADGAKYYNHGIYKENNSTLIVSNGVSGSKSFPYKFLARNEIYLISLRITPTK